MPAWHALCDYVAQFVPGAYDNSELSLADWEKDILELRSKDRNEETVAAVASLVAPRKVGGVYCALAAVDFRCTRAGHMRATQSVQAPPSS